MKFHLDITQFGEFRKTVLTKSSPVLLIPVLAAFLINQDSWESALMILPVYMIIIVLVFINIIKKHKKGWETFELVIDEEKVSRYQEGWPPIELEKSAIEEAIEAKNGGITLLTQPRADSIIIPSSVQNREQLMELIESFTTIRRLERNDWMWKFFVPMIVGVFLLVAFLLSTNTYLVVITGLALFALLVWGFIETQRSKHYDKQIKRSSYAVIILLLVIIIKISWVLNGSIF